MDISSHMLALSLDIATRPKLYRELAPNPYSAKALYIISEKFPESNITDIIRAAIYAEPEGMYDWNFNQLPKERQEEDLLKQKNNSTEIYKLLAQNAEKYALEFKQLPKEFVYDCLSRVVFETTNVKEIEQKYAQKQRREFKLLIIDFIEGTKEKNWQSDPRSFDEKNKEWNANFWNFTQQKTAVGAKDRGELIEILSWVGINIENKSELEFNSEIEEFRKRYLSDKKASIEKLVDDIAKNCQTIESSIDLEKLRQSIDLLQNKGFLNVFGKIPEIRFLVDNYVKSHRLGTQKDHATIIEKILIVVSVMFLITVLSFFITDGWQKKIQTSEVNEQVLGIEDKENGFGIPSYLNISTPSINVDTNIQTLGITSNGDMDVPSNINEVGWFNLGPRPGEKGNAVIAGHFNGPNGKEGVFANLDKLKAGDKLFIKDSKGTLITFVVRESRIYDPGYAEEVFSSNDNGIHLNLITCDGIWDKDKKSYDKRLVVFADILI